MSQAADELRPRIALGVTHVRQTLEELVSDLQEPIAITVEGRRTAVLVPYGQYMAMARACGEAEEAPPPGEGG